MKSRILNPKDGFWETILGVKTSGYHKSVRAGSVVYVPTPYSIIRIALRKLNLGPTDVLVDIGCGMGRPIMYAASFYKLSKVIGIELNNTLVEIAKKNSESIRRPNCPIEVYQMPAEDYNFLGVTAIFLYHPFDELTMRKMLVQIKKSIQNQPRIIRIVYLNPVYQNVLKEVDWLEQCEEIDSTRVKDLKVNINVPALSLWQSK